MAVVIRLRRTGRKNLPCFRITVADSRSPRDGRMVESLGFYDPLARDPARQVAFDAERARYWVAHGAKASDTVSSLFRRAGVFTGEHLPALKVRVTRVGRRKDTQKRTTRLAAKAERVRLKGERFKQRTAKRRAAAKAAKAAAPAES